jgi:hypothetical protein
VGHVVHSGESKPLNDDTLFFMHGWDQCGFHKKQTRTRYTEPVFLHLEGSVGLIVHSVDSLFFMLGCDWYGFNKMCTGKCYAELVFFASGGICGSHSVVQCI